MASNSIKKYIAKLKANENWVGDNASSEKSKSTNSDWRSEYIARIKSGAAAKTYDDEQKAKALLRNNPGYVYSKVYGDGTKGKAAASKIETGKGNGYISVWDGDAVKRNNPGYTYLQQAGGGEKLTKGSDAISAGDIEWYKKILRGIDVGLTDFGKSLVSTADVVTSLGDEDGGPLQELWYMFGGDRIAEAAGDNALGIKGLNFKDNPIKAFNKLGEKEIEYRQKRDAAYADNPLYKYSAATSEAAAMMASTLMGGGLATAVDTAALANAARIGQAASKLSQTGAIAQNAIKQFATRPDAQVIFGSSFGSSYDEAKQDGADDLQALVYAALNGAGNAVTELGGVSELGGLQKLPEWVKKAVNKGDKSLLLNYAKSIGEEASEEIIQGILGRGLKSIYSDVPMYDANDENSIINPKAALEEATGAAVVSTLLGLPTTGINAAYRAKQRGETGQRLYGNSQRELVDEGLESERGTKSYELARKYDEKLNSGKQLSGNELYKLAQANEKAQANEGPAVQPVPEAQTNEESPSLPYAALNREQQLSGLRNYVEQRSEMSAPVNTNVSNNEVVSESINNVAAKIDATPEFVSRVYNLNPVESPKAFETAFNAVYQMGQQGTGKAALYKVPVLNTAQANIAYQMGADSVKNESTDTAVQAATPVQAAPVNINNTQEVNEDGIRIRDGGERIDGQNTEGQIRSVEAGAGENQVGTAQAQPGGSQPAQIKTGEKVSYKGKQQKGVYYAAEDTEDMKKGRKLAENYGYKVRYFIGGNIRYAGGEFRGVVDTANKTAMVRADHPDYTADQIMRHEMGHAAFENGDLSIGEAKELLLEDFTEKELNDMALKYAEAFTMDDGELVMSIDEAFEEICCDALGRMNIFEGTDLNSESYGKAQDTVRKYAAEKNSSKGRAPPKKGGEKYSKEQTKYDYSKPFVDQIDDWKQGKIPKYDTLVIGATPTAFKKVGFNSLPMTINQSHVDYAINGTKNAEHHIGEALLKQLPSALEQPVAIIASETQKGTSVIALLPFTKDGKTVVAPVYIDGFGIQNTVKIDSNAVTSIYGRKNAVSNLLTKALNDHKLTEPHVFYLDKAKAAALYQGSKVTMPKMPNTSDGFVSSIRDANSPVKLKIKDVTESQQFKRWFGNSKVTNADGTPKIVYHQTENEFTVFETRREGAGTRDNGTPFGIFLKSSNKDIGLRGKKQMALYAKIENPLRAKNRSEFLKAMQNMSSEYAEIINQHEALDREYKEKTQSAMKEFKNYIIEWRADNPGVDSRALYDDAKFNELFEAEDTLASEWTSKANKLSTKAKEAMTKALESNGYDGVILEKDDGSFGRSTDAYIALHPEQVKSATDNIGTFDSSNPDIRYSREPERLNELRRQNERKLAQATAEDAANENERGLIRDYQKQYSKIEDIREKLSAAQQTLTEAEDGGADYDTTIKAKNRFTVLSNQYAREHRKLESYANMKALQNVLARVDERLGNDLPEGMGAASANFTGEETVGERWVTEAQGEGDSALHPISKEQEANLAEQQQRAPQEIPKKDLNGKLTSKHVSTIVNSGMTPAEFSEAMLDDAALGKFSHIKYSDEEALEKANGKIAEKGWADALANYKAEVSSGRVSKDNTVMGIALYNNAVNSGDYATAMDIASLMVKNSTNTAQSLQAMRILNKLSPECRLYLAAKSIENIEEDLNERYKDNKADIHVDKILYDEYAKALRQGDEDGIKTAWANIEQSVAQQIDATWYEKLNNFRYLAMLGNPRTHLRNIIGNAGFVPVREVKNIIAYGIENMVDAKIDGGIERSKAILNSSNAADKALIDYGKMDYAAMQDVILSGGKYNDNFSGIDNNRTIYDKFKPLETLRKANSKALDKEDAFFCKNAYAYALARWYKSNGISAEQLFSGQVADETVAKAQAIAVKEAQKATYRDINVFSQWVSRLGKTRYKAVNVLVEGVLPFKKTPANILVRGMEYSPVGLLKSLGDIRRVKAYVNGDVENGMSPAQFIDEVSAGLTGTALVGLGVLLAWQGMLLGGSGDDDKQSKFDELSGNQKYALDCGNFNITLDWLAPECLPVFVGVELYNSWSGKNDSANWFDGLLKALASVTTPVLEMSMLQSVSDLINNIGYVDDASGMYKILSKSVTNYLTQYFPTILGQAERTFEETQRETTYVDRNSAASTELQYMWGKIANKIPFYDFSQIPYIDAWGRTEETGNFFVRALNNFVNPAYVKKARPTEIDDELERLYDLGETGVYPTRPKVNVQIKGEYLTADEYVAYSTRKGQLSLDLATQFINSSEYGRASDAKKAYLIKKAYEYANDIAKYEVNNDVGFGAKWEAEAYKSSNPGKVVLDHWLESYDKNHGDKEN